MQDIYKDLRLLEDEQEEETKDLILDTLNSLTSFYVEEEDGSRKVPWYCMLDGIASDYGYSEQEMSDFAQNNGFIVFKISPIGSFEGGLAVADKDVDFETVKENIKKSVIDDFENEKDVPEVKISFKDKKESLDESNEDVIEETKEYKIVKTIQHNFKTIRGVARKGKDKVIYQVYFRTQDFNPATNRWMNNGWANSTVEFDSVEDARAYVKKYGKELKEELDRVPDEDLKRLEDKIKENGFDIVSKRDYGFDDKPTNVHYQIITKEGNQTKDSFNDYIDFIEETLDEFEDETGAPCTFNMGLQENGYISCGFDVRGVYYKPGEDIKFKKPISLSFRDGKPADDYTKNQLKDIGSHLGLSDDEVVNMMPVDKPKNESIKTPNYFYFHYDNLPIKIWGKEHSATETNPAWADEIESKEDYDYEAKYDDVVDALISIVNEEEEYVLTNFDELLVKYEDELKEYFKDEAIEEAEEYFQKEYNNREPEYESLDDKSLNKRFVRKQVEEDIEKHDTLNPKLFDNNELKLEIKEAIEKIANTFVEDLKEDEVALNLKDIVLVGSNVSYNYTKDSDLDIHLVVDSSALDCPKEIADKLYSAYRSIFNKNYDITIKGIPAEIYVELDNLGAAKSNGIYSLNNGWVKEPTQQDIPEINKEEFEKAFKPWEDRYNELINNESATSEDVEQFINDIYAQRKEGIASGGEYSLGNLLFKECRNKGYLDNLKDLRKELKGKELSLEHLEEEVVSDNDAFWNIRGKISDVISDKYDEVNLIVDNGEIRPITKEEQANKFAVSVEHADKDDFKTKEEIEKIAKDIGAERIMFFVYKGQFGGEYSFLVNDENVARDVANKYNQESYAKFDENGNYHEIKVDKKLNNAYNKRELEYFKHENLRVKRR